MIKKRLSRKLKRGASASIGNHRPQQYKCAVCGRLAPDNKLPCVCGLGKQWRDNPADIPDKHMSKKDSLLLALMNVCIADTFKCMQDEYADAKKAKLSKRDAREVVGAAGDLALGMSRAGPLLRAECRQAVVNKLLKRLKL